ncbi:hypothetical protein [Capnocytophaga catalasegens]|uniref:Uncharacterized protein n=1 Tax=Capnocytophaga catalasegens TaxID=1004260 RepID=A0AAV5ARU1_9FLAO|nr:hypothetical protein [Capnocytophaga catalasegens]GIZ15093.1 hypothetical protein RCZ03_10930 [Capnocytophaga catalasegens]GJM50022.1 hypothetical protein RCZ15_09970 [Capnocytophaga catalasegens]GJM53893.1 hypothetical protein RCZ16_22090 [Capnocytophaga catalasegens]
MHLNLEQLEIHLKKRLDFPYVWGRKQSDSWDKQTNFVYHIRSFTDLEHRIKFLDEKQQNYALNRWLNFWSAKAVEQIFAMNQRVVPYRNEYDKWIDFTIDNIPFDHKTSVFPNGFGKDLNYARIHKGELIQWFYENQSQQGRKHYKNRIFVVLFAQNGQHWKLKTEINFIKIQIEDYLHHFSVEKLKEITFNQEKILSDIIWIIN